MGFFTKCKLHFGEVPPAKTVGIAKLVWSSLQYFWNSLGRSICSPKNQDTSYCFRSRFEKVCLQNIGSVINLSWYNVHSTTTTAEMGSNAYQRLQELSGSLINPLAQDGHGQSGVLTTPPCNRCRKYLEGYLESEPQYLHHPLMQNFSRWSEVVDRKKCRWELGSWRKLAAEGCPSKQTHACTVA